MYGAPSRREPAGHHLPVAASQGHPEARIVEGAHHTGLE